MKHATSRILFAYWDALRGDRAAPERGDIRPGDMRHVLGDAFILANESGANFRLAGTRICGLFGRDLAGQSFRNLWESVDAAEIERLVRLVVDDTAGAVAGVLGVNVNGSHLPLELLLLPLRHAGRTDRRLLGALSPATVPSWAGLVPLQALGLRTVRVIEPGGRDPEVLAAMTERRNHFVVHHGGAI